MITIWRGWRISSTLAGYMAERGTHSIIVAGGIGAIISAILLVEERCLR